MIKSLVILVLLIVAIGGAVLSRPTPADFQALIKTKYEANASGFFGKSVADVRADSYFKDCTINNRVVYLDVKHKGKTVFTGAFNHFFGSDPELSAK